MYLKFIACVPQVEILTQSHFHPDVADFFSLYYLTPLPTSIFSESQLNLSRKLSPHSSPYIRSYLFPEQLQKGLQPLICVVLTSLWNCYLRPKGGSTPCCWGQVSIGHWRQHCSYSECNPQTHTWTDLSHNNMHLQPARRENKYPGCIVKVSAHNALRIILFFMRWHQQLVWHYI